MQVNFFLNFAASLWKEDLTPLLGKSSFMSKPCWSPTDLFVEAFYLWPELSFHCQPFLCQPHLCQPCHCQPFHCQPLPPLTTGSSFANLSLICWLSSSITGLILLWQQVLPLSTSLTITNLTCRCQPHSLWHLPMKQRSLGISLDKTLKSLSHNLVDLFLS